MADALRQTDIRTLKGIGQAQSQKLNRLGIYSIQDLLLHLPHRYEDRTRITPIAALNVEQGAVIEGDVVQVAVQFGRRRSLVVTLRDNSGQLTLRFFHFSKAQQKGLEAKPRLRCYGAPRRGASGLELYHPEYSLSVTAPLSKTLTPVYPATDGITQNFIRRTITQALSLPLLTEGLPPLIPNSDFPDLMVCLKHLHAPPENVDVMQLLAGLDPSQRILALEELTAYQLGLIQMKAQLTVRSAPCLLPDQNLIDAFHQQLGFQLTGAQSRVIEEIFQDLGSKTPMLRLVQGDVGSGKTVVAAFSALIAISSGQQVALMAPTEILAAQHHQTFENWLQPLGIVPRLITGSLKPSLRREHLAALNSGEAEMVIGTHALFQEGVEFSKLGLIIIDEQHRFGVHQRMALRDKGRENESTPHQLIMTATPIPRTLTMTLYANMDCSIIDELPPGRTPIETRVLANHKRQSVMARLKEACGAGAQAYWVCTLIDPSETLNAQAAETLLEELRRELPDLLVELIHGKMSNTDKQRVMADFKAGKTQILVATTVIEVGVDVPNASFMVIENAERLGLTQLHQLRGRIGRGAKESYCLLLYQPPLGQLSKQRLGVMRASQDGFYIAEQDLAIRGPGDVLGERQSGEVAFKIADLARDDDLLPQAHRIAQTIASEHHKQAEALISRWVGAIDHYQQA